MKLKHDLHAQYALPPHDDQTQARGIDFLTGYVSSPPRRWPELAEVKDPAARLCLLAQARYAYTDRARVGQQRGQPGGLWHWIDSGQAKTFFEARRERYLDPLGLGPTLPDLTSLPTCSFALQFTFTLRKPYLSRDDTDWHILDNPVKKEKVFGLPMVAATGWKGALRATMRQEKEHETLEEEQQDRQMVRLFGNVTDEKREEAFRSGRLRFYPNFFTQTGLEVINPHPRESGAGKQPLYFECVPIGAQGTFTLLYVPFDLIGRPEVETRTEIADDLVIVAQGVQAMLTSYGFGAKTSSGFGVAENQVAEGRLVVRTEAKPVPFSFDSLPALLALADAAATQLRPGGTR
jgi:CRISPR-associated protein Cmr2